MIENLNPEQIERYYRLIMELENEPLAKIKLDKVIKKNDYNFSDLFYSALDFTNRLDYKHKGMKSSDYLNHPLRVTTLLLDLKLKIDEECYVTALLHNIFELTNTDFSTISKLFSVKIANNIKVLTIDRKLQHDITYKKKYYKDILLNSPTCALVKIADKIDNIFLLNFNHDKTIKSLYINELKDFVLPLASKFSNELYEILYSAIMNININENLKKDIELKKAIIYRDKVLSKKF